MEKPVGEAHRIRRTYSQGSRTAQSRAAEMSTDRPRSLNFYEMRADSWVTEAV